MAIPLLIFTLMQIAGSVESPRLFSLAFNTFNQFFFYFTRFLVSQKQFYEAKVQIRILA